MNGFTFLLFEYADENGNKITRKEFYECHPGIVSDFDELALLEHDINAWCTLIINEFFNRNIEINSYTRHFVFIEEDRMYFLFEKFRIKYIKIFFRKTCPIIQIFDMKVA